LNVLALFSRHLFECKRSLAVRARYRVRERSKSPVSLIEQPMWSFNNLVTRRANAVVVTEERPM
jgi:hypothetical protein